MFYHLDYIFDRVRNEFRSQLESFVSIDGDSFGFRMMYYSLIEFVEKVVTWGRQLSQFILPYRTLALTWHLSFDPSTSGCWCMQIPDIELIVFLPINKEIKFFLFLLSFLLNIFSNLVQIVIWRTNFLQKFIFVYSNEDALLTLANTAFSKLIIFGIALNIP